MKYHQNPKHRYPQMLAKMCSNKNSYSMFVGMHNSSATLEDSLAVSYKTKHIVTIWSIIVLLGINPKELNTYFHTKICTQMFIEALFIASKTWRQTRCSSDGEWMKKLWQIQTIEYYSALKRNQLSSHEQTRTKSKCILLSEGSPSEKATYAVTLTIWHSGKG